MLDQLASASIADNVRPCTDIAAPPIVAG
jgi:hypothetical protein